MSGSIGKPFCLRNMQELVRPVEGTAGSASGLLEMMLNMRGCTLLLPLVVYLGHSRGEEGGGAGLLQDVWHQVAGIGGPPRLGTEPAQCQIHGRAPSVPVPHPE